MAGRNERMAEPGARHPNPDRGHSVRRKVVAAAASAWRRAGGIVLAVSLAASLFASSAAASSNAVVPVSGTVGGAPEVVSFSGKVRIRSTLVKDPDFGKPPTVQLAIDLIDVVGKGLTSGAKYVTTAEFINNTELDGHEVIEISFPFQPDSSKGHLTARAGLMALTLKFDARDGAIIGAACRISGVQ
jgi:hypothetical protein